MVDIGKAASDFCLASANNDEICLKDHAGKWLVLFFYVKDNTSG
jgi:peroxiredoxin Q/BCP